jgi:hypothetical protein
MGNQVPDGAFSRLINVPVESGVLEGMLEGPADARGLVVFAHGSGSSRLSPRNGAVARVLREVGLATLLIDLLTAREDQDYDARFDIDLLTRRLGVATDWLRTQAPEGRSADRLFRGEHRCGRCVECRGAAARHRSGRVARRPPRSGLAQSVERGACADAADRRQPR